MKIRLPSKKPIGRLITTRDESKNQRLELALTKHSQAQRVEQLVDAKLEVIPQGRNTTVTLKTNIQAGQLQGADPEVQKKKNAMRRFYNKQMPVLQCANCALKTSCPQFKAGYECAFLPFLNEHEVKDTRDLIFYLRELLGSNIRRAHVATIMETLSGGTPSLELSEAMNMLFQQAAKLHELETKANVGELSISTSDSSIISQLFGNLGNLVGHTSRVMENPILLTPEEIARVSSERKGVAATGQIQGRPTDTNEQLLKEFTGLEVGVTIPEIETTGQSGLEVAQLNQ